MTLPRFLSGRGLDGTVVVTLQINEKLVAAIHKAITFVKTRLERLQQKLIGGAHMISDVAKGFRGPAQDSGAEIAVPAVGDPVDLSRAAEIRIAYRFAPVIHQIVGTAGYPQTADMMRRVDYDGDWDTTNNWNNTDSANADNGGYAYYDVKESATHYFVTYAFYYARRSGNYATRHENDMTGIVVVARKGARAGEEIELVQLRESNSFDHYAAEAAEGWKANGVSKHSPLNFIDEVDHPYYDTERTHPQIFVKAAGHGVYGYNGRNDVSAFFGNPGITYQPKANPAVPGLPNSTVGYSLIPMSDLENIKTLTEDGKMDGNEGFAQHARLPSSWPGFENPAKRLEKIYPGVDFGGSVLPPVVETRGPAVRGMLDVVEDSTEDLELRIRILELERERLEIERIDLDNARPLRRVGGNEDADIETELKRLDALDVNGLEKEFERLNKLSREGRE